MELRTRTQPVQVELPAFGISAILSRHGRSFQMREMTNPFHKLVVVLSGEGWLESGGPASARLGRHHLVRVPAERPHRFRDRPVQPLTLGVLCVAPEVAEREPLGELWRKVEESFPPCVPVHGVEDAPGHAAVLSRIVREVTEQRPGHGAMVLGLTLQWLVTLSRGARRAAAPVAGRAKLPADRSLEACIAHLDDHFTSPVHVADLAAMAGMSYRSFTDHFRRRTGLTVMQYVHRRRLDLACRRLLTTGDIVSSALEAGFNDLSHFYQLFRRRHGAPPAQWLQERGGGGHDRRTVAPPEVCR